MLWDQNSYRGTFAKWHEDTCEGNREGIGKRSMVALRDLRGSTATHLAAGRRKSRVEDCAICEGTWIPPEVLQARNVRDLRERAVYADVAGVEFSGVSFARLSVVSLFCFALAERSSVCASRRQTHPRSITKSAPENLPEIARQLGVVHILEGSVQKSGDDRAAFQRREPR
jgi:hypothetical protein